MIPCHCRSHSNIYGSVFYGILYVLYNDRVPSYTSFFSSIKNSNVGNTDEPELIHSMGRHEGPNKELDNSDSDSENVEHRVFISSALLEAKVNQLESSQVKILTTPLPDEGMKKDLEDLRGEIKRLAKDTRAKLQSIEVKEDEELVMRSVLSQMRRTQHGVLSKRFIELINQCNNKNILHSKDYVEKAKQQLMLAVENKQQARKKKVYIAICVSVLILIIILIIVIVMLS
uniref:Syntaxin N-terminal domain-containing protein n=1 Tax=Leptobrachium leishanense TaxID=445787 RepID=A0A8C5QAS4_9ANUR